MKSHRLESNAAVPRPRTPNQAEHSARGHGSLTADTHLDLALLALLATGRLVGTSSAASEKVWGDRA